MRSALAAIVVAAMTARPAAAGPLDLQLISARQVSHAGASLVGDDGLGALRSCPASLARRGGARIELGMMLLDQDASFRVAGAGTQGSPTIRDRGGPSELPSALIAIGRGRLVLALAYAATAAAAHALPAPDPDQLAADVRRLFPHRYGGTSTSVSLRTLMAGVAVRAGDWLGLGAAVHASTARVQERRSVWAGFAGRDELGDPSRDLTLALSADDALVLGGSLGALIAPPELPLELAVSVSGRQAIRGSGTAGLTVAHAGDLPAPILGAAADRILVRAPVTLAAGLRYLGDRLTIEADVELAAFDDAARAPRWRLDGARVRDDSGQIGELDRAPSLLSQRSYATGRGAVDVEVARGFLWLTVGYAYAGAATAPARLAPAAGDLGGHTASVGAEASWDDVTLALGYARTFASARTISAGATEVAMINPFGDASGSQAAAPGRFDDAADTVALDLRVAWP